LLNEAYKDATAGPAQGLWNIDHEVSRGGKYDFGENYKTEEDTWRYGGKILSADQMGNFIAGFQGAAYDKVFEGGAPVAEKMVEAGGIYYHITGATKAKNDPLDKTGRPDIKAGEAAGQKFTPSPNAQDDKEGNVEVTAKAKKCHAGSQDCEVKSDIDSAREKAKAHYRPGPDSPQARF
jgi:hypothetical protein